MCRWDIWHGGATGQRHREWAPFAAGQALPMPAGSGPVYEGTSTTLPPPNESVSMSAYEWCEFKPLTSVQRKKGHRFPSPLTIEQRSVREQVARLCFKMHVCMPLLDTLTHLPLLFCSNGSRNTPPRVDIRNTTLSVMKAACSLKVQASWTTNE
jgi:hypothetical protein